MLIADDLSEDAPRLLADDLCPYSLSGKHSPASSLASLTFVAIVVVFHG
jgi:hypothetical protein